MRHLMGSGIVLALFATTAAAQDQTAPAPTLGAPAQINEDAVRMHKPYTVTKEAVRAAGSSVGLTRLPTLPPCQDNVTPVTLQILTNASSGWVVNGVPAVALSTWGSGWATASPAQWIGVPDEDPPAVLTYVVHFQAPGQHGAMAVSAHWAADNCGTSLQGGTGTPQPTGPCYGQGSPNGSDFMYFNHYTTASFAPADSSNPNPSITFTIGNMLATRAGMAGVFTVTAQCRV